MGLLVPRLVEDGVGWGREEQSPNGVANRFLPCFPAAFP